MGCQKRSPKKEGREKWGGGGAKKRAGAPKKGWEEGWKGGGMEEEGEWGWSDPKREPEEEDGVGGGLKVMGGGEAQKGGWEP